MSIEQDAITELIGKTMQLARGTYESTKIATIQEDVANYVGDELWKAQKLFPNDPEKQKEYLGARMGDAILRNLEISTMRQ